MPLLPAAGPYAIMSDFHLGNGRRADDFRHNEDTLEAALGHYEENGFSLILLGDIEELWQFGTPDILARYEATIYARLRAFGPARIHRVFGNHDIDWAHTCDPLWSEGGSPAPEAVKLVDRQGVPRFLLTHGHQGSAESDRFSRLSRPLVRAFRVFEPLARTLGLYRNPVTAPSRITMAYEKIMHGWAKETGAVLVCGHSHRAVFASQSYADRLRRDIAELEARRRPTEGEGLRDDDTSELDRLRQELRDEILKGRDIEATDDGLPLPCYFNCGCALYRDGLTLLELADEEIRLVKWHRDPAVTPRREVYQHGSLTEILAQIAGLPAVCA